MKKHFTLIPILTLTTQTLIPFFVTSCSSNNQFDLKQMRTDYTNMLKYTTDTSAEKMMIDHLVDDSEGNLIFDDLDYSSQDKANWPALKHLTRAIPIAVDAAARNDVQQHEKVVKLVRHWLKHDYQNPNWWNVQIGTPRDLSDVALFVYEDLTTTEQSKLIEILRRGSLLYNTSIPSSRKTGTNLFWYADITMKDAWLTSDTKELELMVNSVLNEIKENEQDGFQSDGSYYQHDHQLYNGGYGRQGVILLAKIMSAFSHSKYQWPTEKLEIVVNFILNGLSTTIQNGYTDYLTMGRTYCRKEANQLDGGTTDLGNVLLLKYIADLPNCPHKDELIRVFTSWKDGTPSFEGIKYLEKSNFISMNCDGIYMSFKGTNSNMRNSEKCNGENALGYNLSYGTNTCVMETGKEYFDITPVWDYSSLPGTTSLDETDAQLDAYENEANIRRKLNSDGIYGGGIDNGVTFSMQKAVHELTKFTVTCFATHEGMVILGAGLSNHLGDLHTTVEQCIISESMPILSADKQTVTHGNVVYTNLSPNDELEMTTGAVTNSWNRNNRSYSTEDKLTKNILKVKIKHNEFNDRYAYCIQPASKVDNKFTVIVNTSDVQAILLPNTKIAAAFYADTSFQYQGKTCEGKAGEYKVF